MKLFCLHYYKEHFITHTEVVNLRFRKHPKKVYTTVYKCLKCGKKKYKKIWKKYDNYLKDVYPWKH